MELLDDLGQIEASFDLFGDSANLHVRNGHSLRRTCNGLRDHFGPPMELLGDVGEVEASFGPFGDGVNLSAR
jgi:hypothetical protein